MENETNQRDSFVFYRGFRDSINECPLDEQLEIYKNIVDYALDGIEPDLQTSFGKVCWRLIKPILDKNWSRYRNGCKGGAPLGNTNNKGKKSTKSQPKVNQKSTESQPKVNQKSTEVQPNDNVNDNVSSNEDIKKEICIKKKSATTEPISEEERKFLDGMQEHYPSVCKMKEPLTFQQYQKLQGEYTAEAIRDILERMENYAQLRTKCKSAYLTIRNWIRRQNR